MWCSSDYVSLSVVTFQPTIAQAEDAIETVEEFLVVGDRNDCLLLKGNPAKQIHHNTYALGVASGCRLVGKDDARPIGERA
ncbi:MAG: hypothetical protein AB7S70_01045 [Hyphomicrobium sp.]